MAVALENGAVRRTTRPVMHEASNLGQSDKSAQSNQQDLIDEIEANRQKSARWEAVLLGASVNQRSLVSKQRCNKCLGRLNKRITARAD